MIYKEYTLGCMGADFNPEIEEGTLIDNEGNPLKKEDLYDMFNECLDTFEKTQSGSDTDENDRQIAIIELLSHFVDKFGYAYHEHDVTPDDCYETFVDILNGSDKDKEFDTLSADFIQ